MFEAKISFHDAAEHLLGSITSLRDVTSKALWMLSSTLKWGPMGDNLGPVLGTTSTPKNRQDGFLGYDPPLRTLVVDPDLPGWLVEAAIYKSGVTRLSLVLRDELVTQKQDLSPPDAESARDLSMSEIASQKVLKTLSAEVPALLMGPYLVTPFVWIHPLGRFLLGGTPWREWTDMEGVRRLHELALPSRVS